MKLAYGPSDCNAEDFVTDSQLITRLREYLMGVERNGRRRARGHSHVSGRQRGQGPVLDRSSRTPLEAIGWCLPQCTTST